MLPLALSLFSLLALSSHFLGRVAASTQVDTAHYFNQLVDHKNRLSGKFKQRYWLNSEYYKSGGPIFLVVGGSDQNIETVAFIKPGGFVDAHAQNLKAACVVLEHRYFGESRPYEDLSEKSLERLTIQQSIDDLAYFAQKVKLPAPVGWAHPDNNPWIIVGVGYAGALANWAMLRYKDIFFAGYASSAQVLAKEDLWQYWDFVRKKMPSDCASDVQDVSKYIDDVAGSGDPALEEDLKRLLRLDDVTNMVDVAASLVSSLETWDFRVTPKMPSSFDKLCDAILGGYSGRMDSTLAAWGRWNAENFEGNDDAFWGTYDKNHTQYTEANPERPWHWLQCNELGWFRTAAHRGFPTLVPRLLDVKNERRMCAMHFPQTYKDLDAPRIAETNSRFGNKQAARLFATVGQYDAWAASGVSFSPNDDGDEAPVVVVTAGFISADVVLRKDPFKAIVQRKANSYFHHWLEQWKSEKSASSNKSWWNIKKPKASQE